MFCRKTARKVFFAITLANFIVALPLMAHHSFAAEYDDAKPLTLTGTVVKWGAH